MIFIFMFPKQFAGRNECSLKKKKTKLPALSLKAALHCGDLKGVKVVTLQT